MIDEKFIVNNVPEIDGPTIIGYGKSAKEIEPENKFCLAKKVKQNGVETFFVKRSSKNTSFFNHNDDSLQENDIYNASTGKRNFEFVRVTRNAFSHYIKFLQTDNEVHLRAAQRDL